MFKFALIKLFALMFGLSLASVAAVWGYNACNPGNGGGNPNPNPGVVHSVPDTGSTGAMLGIVLASVGAVAVYNKPHKSQLR